MIFIEMQHSVVEVIDCSRYKWRSAILTS